MTEFFNDYFYNLDKKIRSIDSSELIKLSELIFKSHTSGGKVIIIGNGGSAAIASHASIDFTKAAKIR